MSRQRIGQVGILVACDGVARRDKTDAAPVSKRRRRAPANHGAEF